MTKINEIKEQICKIINNSGLSKSQTGHLINDLVEKYSKNYDEPVLNDTIIKLANKIIKINPNVKYIPIGYHYADYSNWRFTCDFDSVFEVLENLEGIPTFEDEMTKKQWHTTIDCWEKIIDESQVYEGYEEGDMCYDSHITPLVFNIETQEFEELPEL